MISDNESMILTAMYHAGMTRTTVKEICVYLTGPLHSDRGGVSSRLCKLRTKGMVMSDHSDNSNYWSLTDSGMAYLREHLPSCAPDPTPPVAAAEEAPPEVEAPPVADTEPDPLARELLVAMELEQALETLRARLQARPVPARSARVYRDLLGALPPVLRDALVPVTALVKIFERG